MDPKYDKISIIVYTFSDVLGQIGGIGVMILLLGYYLARFFQT